MAWGYLARAYAIQDYADMRATEAENEDARSDEEADKNEAVKDDIKIVLEMAEDNFSSVKETPEEYRTIRQCKKWLKDFDRT